MNALLAVIADRCQRVRWKGSEEFSASCPNHLAHKHGDRNKSFSAKATHDRVLLHCHAGCTLDEICRAISMEEHELFFEKKRHGPNGHSKKPAAPPPPIEMPRTESRTVVATYEYVDEHNKALFESVRFDPKGFAQRRRENGHYEWNLQGVRLVLYNLPMVLHSETVFVVEGEKDVETMREKFGLVATCNPMGAGKWRDEFSEFLAGKTIVIIPDNDKPGLDHAHKVAGSLYGKAKSVAICQLPEKVKDISEWQFSKQALVEYLSSFSVAWTPAAATEVVFHTFEEFEKMKPITFAIEGFLQNDASTAIAGLAGHGKTFVMLSMVKALLTGAKLWDLFEVRERATRVIYLIPESTLAAFKHRLCIMGLYDEVRTGRLLVRTLTKGPTIPLDNPLLIEAARDAHVFLDTAVRFAVPGTDENSASDNQGLANDIFSLLRAGAKSVPFAHHATKSFRQADEMFLENVMRGTSDLGAICATAWGVKQIDRDSNILHIENVKPRDFQPCGPFQLQGRPSIDELRDFSLHKAPGSCGTLAEEAPNELNSDRHQKADDRVQIVKSLWLTDPNMTSPEMCAYFQEKLGIEIAASSMRRYRAQARK